MLINRSKKYIELKGEYIEKNISIRELLDLPSRKSNDHLKANICIEIITAVQISFEGVKDNVGGMNIPL